MTALHQGGSLGQEEQVVGAQQQGQWCGQQQHREGQLPNFFQLGDPAALEIFEVFGFGIQLANAKGQQGSCGK